MTDTAPHRIDNPNIFIRSDDAHRAVGMAAREAVERRERCPDLVHLTIENDGGWTVLTLTHDELGDDARRVQRMSVLRDVA